MCRVQLQGAVLTLGRCVCVLCGVGEGGSGLWAGGLEVGRWPSLGDTAESAK